MTGVDVRGSCAGSVRPGCIVALSSLGLLRYGSTDWREGMARLNGTLTVVLTKPLSSQDGRRRYETGETVSIAIAASSDVRVWSGSREPVLATFHELVGSELPDDLNA